MASGEPAHVARYAFQLAQSFSNFYHEYPVLSESNAEKKTFLLWMTEYFRVQLERTLAVLAEQTGMAIPTVVLPAVSAPLAARPQFARSVKTLRAEGVSSGELGIAFVGPEEMRELNRAHLGIDEATDVLS